MHCPFLCIFACTTIVHSLNLCGLIKFSIFQKKNNRTNRIKYFLFISFQGTADEKIIFTTQPDSGYTESIPTNPEVFGARLVDGSSPLAGRLQIFYENKWRSVCTNSRKYVITNRYRDTNAN